MHKHKSICDFEMIKCRLNVDVVTACTATNNISHPSSLVDLFVRWCARYHILACLLFSMLLLWGGWMNTAAGIIAVQCYKSIITAQCKTIFDMAYYGFDVSVAWVNKYMCVMFAPLDWHQRTCPNDVWVFEIILHFLPFVSYRSYCWINSNI